MPIRARLEAKTVPYEFTSARDLFESAREAAMDAERCMRQLERMESSALSLGGASFEPRVSATSETDRMGAMVAAYVDMQARLRARQDDDYAVIDYATSVIYGRDQDSRGGVAALLSHAHADALWWHYLGCETWEDVAETIHFSVGRCKQMRNEAFDLVDAVGMDAVLDGRGLAED